jgi:hypothetical protein
MNVKKILKLILMVFGIAIELSLIPIAWLVNKVEEYTDERGVK